MTQPFYAQHSLITDLRDKGLPAADLPKRVPELMRVVQGLLIHTGWAQHYGCEFEEVRNKELYLRTLPEMLEGIAALDSRPLAQARQPRHRLVSLCRDFSLLLVALLRQGGRAARLRVGFAGYFGDQNPKFWDHRLAEYWEDERECWVMVDPMMDEVVKGTLSRAIDPLEIDATSPFLVAGDVWQRCRAGQLDPQDFGDAPDDKGMAPIRYALLHDFDALNKVEVVGFDAWHPLIDKPESDLTRADYAFLDEVADLTLNVDQTFRALRDTYSSSEYGQTMRKIASRVIETYSVCKNHCDN